MSEAGRNRTRGDGEVAERILKIAQQLADEQPEPQDAEDVACDRGWLDDAGEPTQDGRDLVAALGEQSETRTIFRNV